MKWVDEAELQGSEAGARKLRTFRRMLMKRGTHLSRSLAPSLDHLPAHAHEARYAEGAAIAPLARSLPLLIIHIGPSNPLAIHAAVQPLM